MNNEHIYNSIRVIDLALNWVFSRKKGSINLKKKRIAILGSTGSIGKQALDVIDALGEQYEIVALTAQKSVELLSQQVKRYKPKFAAIADENFEKPLRQALAGEHVEILSGSESLVRIAELDEVDVVLTAVVGSAGL